MRIGALVVAVLAAGCSWEAREAPAPHPLLLPVARLLDAPPPRPRPDLEWGRHVKIAGESRLAVVPAIESSVFLPATSPSDAPPGRWTVRVPDALRSSRWLLVRPGLVVGDGPTAFLPRSLVDAGTAADEIVVPGGVELSIPGVRVVVAMDAVRPLAAYDVVGAPFVVPAGAVATTGYGIHEGAWSGDAGAVEFRIGVVEGDRETILHRATLDPARRPGDRHWFDARVDLSAFAGRRVQLALRTAPAAAARDAPSLPVWADPVVLAPRPAWMPNVILMSLDTLRAKSVSAYGALRPTTPNLDRLVGTAGTVFDNAYTPAPHTFPAHLSAFTGLYPRALANINPTNALPHDVPTLPERLRAAGYDTAAFTEDGFVVPKVGFQRGFATYVENTSPDFHQPLGQSAKTFREAADWLAERRDHPTFLFVHTYEVHVPYAPAPPYDRAFGPAGDLPDQNAVDLLRYEQEARHLDDEIRAFLDAVDAYGLGTRTLLVVMADHGEEFGEHGLRYHGFHLYGETTHVPLMLRWPEVVPAGLRVKTPASLVDLLPTILDLVGAPPVVGIHGESLVPLLAGGTLSARRKAVFGEVAMPGSKGVDTVSARTADLHCLFQRHTGKSECFEPAIDPDEKTPLLDRPGRMDLPRLEAVTYWGLRDPLAPAPPPDLAGAASRDERTEHERREKLRALGYVE